MVYLRATALLLALIATFAIGVPLQWLARRLGWPLRHRIQMYFSRIVCVIIGIRVEAHGRLAGAGPRFAVANHVSWTDVLALSSLHPFVFLAKLEVAGWPVLGVLARLQDTIFVERGNRRAIPQVNGALATAMRSGRDVVVFAEGTSSDGSGVLKFNASHFAMLSDIEADEASPVAVTLAPVAIVYTDAAEGDGVRATPIDVGWYGDMTFVPHLWSLMKRGGVRCHISFGEAIAMAGRDRKALAAATESRVRDLLQAARRFDAADPPKKSR
jgi:1-acyl-sn-glycerol-3-phosphate acyltransferase